MSEHITHVAVYEDCARIISLSEFNFSPAFREALEKAYDSGMICSASRGNHLYAVPIITRSRELYGTGEYRQQEIEQLAGAIGWLTHRASDLQMKPLFRQVDKLENPVLYSDECQMYHDAVSFEEVYAGGEKNTKSDYERIDRSLLSHSMQANPSSYHFGMDQMERLFSHYYVAGLLTNYLFTEELEDVDEFAGKMVEYSQDLYEDLRMYIRAYHDPDPYKYQGYIGNFNVYDRQDPLIRFVRYVQEHHKPHPEIDLMEALESAPRQSHYSRALRRGHDFVAAASEFFQKKISREEVIRRCEIN